MATQRRFEVMGEDIFKILNKVLGDQELLKLLKYTDKDPLSHPDLTDEEKDALLEDSVLITPNIPDDDRIEKNYLVILLKNYSVDSDNEDFKVVEISFDILCPTKCWVMNGANLRPYSIMQRIDTLFNEKNLAGIGNLNFETSNLVVISPYLAGYSMTYEHHEFN